MAGTPYMRFYVGDYLADTTHLSCAEHGAYLLLLLAYWQNRGPLENDPKLLRRLTRTTPKEFQKVSKNVLKMFQVTDSHIVHKRVDFELDRIGQLSAQNRNAANARWCERNANAMRTQCERNATPIFHSSDTRVLVERDTIPKKNNSNTISPSTPETFADFWTAYPRKVSKQDAEKKYKALLKSGTSHDTIMARLKVYTSQLKDAATEERFIKHPARFLNTLDDYEKPTEPLPTSRSRYDDDDEYRPRQRTTEELDRDCIVVTPEMRELIRRSKPGYKPPEPEPQEHLEPEQPEERTSANDFPW